MAVSLSEPVQFGRFSLDLERAVLFSGGAPVKLGSRALDLLCALVRAGGAVLTKSELMAHAWPGLVVEENNLQAQISSLRKALGVQGDGQDWIRTVPGRGYRFVGAPQAERPVQVPAQEVRFCRTADGVTLASAALGQGPPLVRTGLWMTHLEYEWRVPLWSGLLGRLAERTCLIRYDQRGNGLSDWSIPELYPGFGVTDLEAVIDSHGLERVSLLGLSQGVASAIAYTVKHPDRVERLVLHGGYAVGFRRSGHPARTARSEALISLIRAGWGQDNPAFRQVFTSLGAPGSSREEMDAYNELQRLSASPENAARLTSVLGDVDVRPLLAKVRCPTLVMHSRRDAWVPMEASRAIAAAIPDARFVSFDSANHILLPSEPEWGRFVGEILDFVSASPMPLN